MQSCFERAVEVTGKRFKPSSLAVYRSVWKRLCRTLAPSEDAPFEVSEALLRMAIADSGAYATGRKALGLFRWVSESLERDGVFLGRAYLALSDDYAVAERPDHEVSNFEGAARALILAAEGASAGWKGARLLVIVHLLTEVGMRREELLSLQLAHVSTLEETCCVQVGKGRRIRSFALSAAASAAMRAWLAVRPASDSSVLLVSGPSGEAMDASTLWRQLRRLEALSQPADKTVSGPSAFRAGVARRLKLQGVPLADVQKALGHLRAESTEELLNRV